MIINKKRFSQIGRIQKDSYKKIRLSQMISIGGLMGVTSVVQQMRLSRQFPVCLFFLRKNCKRTKTQIKPNQTREQKTTKAAIFRTQKLLRGRKLFILRFLKTKIALITSFTILHIYIYTNLPVNAKVRLPHPRRGNSQGQETFLAPSAETRNYDAKCSNHHPSLSTLRSKRLSVA